MLSFFTSAPGRVVRRRQGALALLATLACGLLLAALPAQAREITDMLGRKVEVPERIQRVLGTSPPLTALLMVLAPDTLLALNLPPQPGDERFLPAGVPQLPQIGSMLGHGVNGATMNAETILALKPDVALAWGGEISMSNVDNIVRQFERIGVPVLFVNVDTLADWRRAFDFVGSLLGRGERAAQLGGEVQAALDKVQAAVADVPAARRTRVYYAQGADGLSTECSESFHVEPIALAGGYNVHRCKPSSHVGMEKVSLEQVLAWDPDVIIVQDRAFLARLGADGPWRKVRAVREGRVLLVPRTPMNWLDRPPSFMRALGIQWLANRFYPHRFPVDLAATTRDFYQRFYGVEPDPAQIAQWLATPVLGTDAGAMAPAPGAIPTAAPEGGMHHNHGQH
ncbi:ABC transporter substrate-binding protein [Azoarcus sp. TTM-91]|uniref:ABC transporter substrate-binding protein n=1 Tax=Azoarcus sp. TTM-91 TaxID=2691581 RepID=UPI00145D6AA4|nr:ABC transporter substrate-binding protein [Azoarcus sp. TTM-91]NMG33732.1 ABC transporter substrate-binding protein [Azoarcus sp. TTM-91]